MDFILWMLHKIRILHDYLRLLGVAVLGDDGELLPVEAAVVGALPRGERRHRRGGVGDLT